MPDPYNFCAVSYRDSKAPDIRINTRGFRLARSL